MNIAVQLIEIGKIDAKKVIVLDSAVKLLRKQISAKNTQLAAYIQREKTYDLLVANYKKEIQLRSQSQDISTAWVTTLQIDLRRQRTKTTIVGILGLVATGLTLYLTTK